MRDAALFCALCWMVGLLFQVCRVSGFLLLGYDNNVKYLGCFLFWRSFVPSRQNWSAVSGGGLYDRSAVETAGAVL